MPRKPSVNYWASRGGYGCWHKGQQVILAKGPDDFPDGPTYSAAVKYFGELVNGQPRALAFGELAEKYTEWVRAHRKEGTAKNAVRCLKAACERFGQTPVADITSDALEAWCDEKMKARKWGRATVHLMLTVVQACIRWALDRSLVAINPIRRLDRPQMPSRGMHCVLTADQVDRCLKAAHRQFRDLLIVLRDTGARPGELRQVEALHFSSNLMALVIPAAVRSRGATHKTGRFGRDRVIYLKGESLEVIIRLSKVYPTGPLFRTMMPKRRGQQVGKRGGWTVDGLDRSFRRLKKKTGIRGLISYSLRHTYAVNWLRAKKPIEALATVLGTSITMIMKHYGHLADQHDHLRRLIEE